MLTSFLFCNLIESLVRCSVTFFLFFIVCTLLLFVALLQVVHTQMWYFGTTWPSLTAFPFLFHHCTLLLWQERQRAGDMIFSFLQRYLVSMKEWFANSDFTNSVLICYCGSRFSAFFYLYLCLNLIWLFWARVFLLRVFRFCSSNIQARLLYSQVHKNCVGLWVVCVWNSLYILGLEIIILGPVET